MADAELVAVSARRAEAATELTGQFGGTAYDDLDAFLAHDGLEVVTICTPSGAHLEPAIAAARGGTLVFVDDDNVLAEDYLEQVRRIFAEREDLGTVGGRRPGSSRPSRRRGHDIS